MLGQSNRVGRARATSDPRQALHEFIQIKPDLLIVDRNFEFVRKVRRSPENTNRSVPIIMLTGRTELPLIVEARDAGVNQFLVKPISAERLNKRIIATLEDSRPFICVENYVGPDRRRQDIGPLDGIAERRKQPA